MIMMSSSSRLPVVLVFGTWLWMSMTTPVIQAQLQQDIPTTCPWVSPRTLSSSSSNNDDAEDGIRTLVVGVPPRFWADMSPLIDKYLNEYVGRLFASPTIQFVTKPSADYLEDATTAEEARALGFDMAITSNHVISCMMEENTGGTVLANRIVPPEDESSNSDYNATEFGVVAVALKNNTAVNSVADAKGKIVVSHPFGGVSAMLSLQTLATHGVHPYQGPKQLLFVRRVPQMTSLMKNGLADIAIIRTGLLNETRDEDTGELIDVPNVYKILNEQAINPEYPWATSSVLVPEWPFVAFPHVDTEITSLVQRELLSMREHADVAPALLACLESRNCTTITGGTIDLDNLVFPSNGTTCLSECFDSLSPGGTIRNCETTPQKALDAFFVLKHIQASGFRPPVYDTVIRQIQRTAGFLRQVEESASSGGDDGQSYCVRFPDDGFDEVITCPDGYFKRPSAEIHQQCERFGLPCYNSDCVCDPCVQAYEVDFFPSRRPGSGNDDDDDDEEEEYGIGSGCAEFSVCGSVPQEHILSFTALDNVRRGNDTTMSGILLTSSDGIDKEEPFLFQSWGNHTFAYDFRATQMTVGQKIVKIFINGEEIPESPFRIAVTARDCAADTGDNRRIPDSLGTCVCDSGMVEMGDKCVPLAVLLPSILGPIFLIFLLGGYLYIRHKQETSDSIWKVDPDELIFDDTPRILGRGTFGMVLLAEYRGTAVAVKRVLPPENSKSSTSGGTGTGAGSQRNFGTKGGILPFSVSSLFDFDGNKNKEGIPESAVATATNDSNGGDKSGQYDANASFRDSTASFSGVESQGVTGGKYGGKRSRFLRRLSSSASKSSSNQQQLQENFIQEMRLLSKLRHPSITTVMGAVISNKAEPMMIMEYMHLGSLYDLLHNECMVLEGEMMVHMLRDVAKGLRFLHASKPKVIHGDLKAQNVLVDDKFRAKVADFGLSRKGLFQKEKANGTPYWMAPELLRGDSLNTSESDVYAFGIVMYEVFSRKEPYVGERYADVIKMVTSTVTKKRPPVPAECPAEAANLMVTCLEEKPADRPLASEIDARLGLMNTDIMDSLTKVTSLQKKKTSNTEQLLLQLFPRHVAEALHAGRKVEPESHEEVTIFFSDIVGYTKIASTMPPTKVSDMLDRLYTKFDGLCDKLHVFKVETIGDAYMCVTNLETPQSNHVSIMAEFAVQAVQLASTVLIDTDNPSAGHVTIRVGFHTGPVVTHVVGSRTPRYTLIGDTVNTASRMESNSLPGQIQCSEDSYKLLPSSLLARQSSGYSVRSRGMIHVKGKGDMKTYWIEPTDTSQPDVTPSLTLEPGSDVNGNDNNNNNNNIQQLADWNIQVFTKLVKEINLYHKSSSGRIESDQPPSTELRRHKSVIEEINRIIPFDVRKKQQTVNPAAITAVILDDMIEKQISDFVSTISHMYRNDNAFHNFEHASHVTMSAMKLMNQFPNTTFTSDPIARLAVVLACLAHDVDHPGVPNRQLVVENSQLAQTYQNQSVAEQNSADLAWGLFMDVRFTNLRLQICPTLADLQRFHDLFIKCLLATDVMDKDLTTLWKKQCDDCIAAAAAKNKNESDEEAHQMRHANVLLAVVMQSADVAHTMQQWAVYRKWNQALFHECEEAYRAGRGGGGGTDPADNWFQGETGFLEYYVIPLARRLDALGASAEYVTAAVSNKEQWMTYGKQVIEEMKNAKK